MIQNSPRINLSIIILYYNSMDPLKGLIAFTPEREDAIAWIINMVCQRPADLGYS